MNTELGKWIIDADEALKEADIVTEDLNFSSVYKGYISSFGASIIQSGFVAAAAFFEKEDTDSDASRYAVVKAVIFLLQKRGILEKEDPKKERPLLSEYALASAITLKDVDRAIASLKIALRQYTPVKEQEKKNKEKVDAKGEEKHGSQEYISFDEYQKRYVNTERSNSKANVGWLYYQDYYRDFTHQLPREIVVKEKKIKGKTDVELNYKKKNEYILSSSFIDLGKNNYFLIDMLKCNTQLCFKTTYPGLLVGAGLSHGTGAKNDMKIGFQFDYTTGLPYIPGSSVKGVLRSMFPLIKEMGKLSEKEWTYSQRRIKYIQHILKEMNFSGKQIIALTKDIFDTPALNEKDVKRRKDVFMDALIVKSENKGSWIMGDDFITPHKYPLKNPVPLQFLKVLPGVTFCFSFYLYPSVIGNVIVTKEQKENIFKRILEDIGVGAKTNVGYGQLKFAGKLNNTCELCME